MWVLLSAILVFMMTASVGLLEVGELGEDISQSLLKGILITGIGVAVMAFIGFNTAFAPTLDGIIAIRFTRAYFLAVFQRM